MKPLFAVVLTAFLITIKLFSQSQTFIIGFAGNYPEYYSYGASQYVHWEWYDELSLNMWQGFGIGDRQAEVLNNLSANRVGYFDPDTIKWAYFGKVTIIQAETTSNRFRYNYHWCGVNVKDNQWANGDTVRYFDKNSLCPPEETSAGMVLSNVHENAMQSFGNADPMFEYPLPNPNGPGSILNPGKWFIKPRVRINVSDTLEDKPVFKLIIRAYDSSLVYERTIYTSNFRDTIGHYHGEYLEEYWNIPPIMVLADTNNLNRGIPPTHNWAYYDIEHCYVDYQIYWYGQVSMWVDYVKIMNRPAHLLFGNTQEAKDIRSAIKRKTETLIYHSGSQWMKGYYTEEIDYPALTCMKAVQDLLFAWFPSHHDKVQIYGLINYETYSFNLRTHYGTEVQEYFDAVHPPIFMSIVYPFDGEAPWTLLPNNVGFVDPGEPYPSPNIRAYEEPKINAMLVSFPVYNSYLQGELQVEADTQYYMYTQAKNNNIRFIAEPAFCQWGGVWGQYQREPMNSELSVQVGIALCRGAQGIMPFEYMTFMSCGVDTPFCYGMTDVTQPNNSCWGDGRRLYNFYGEEKWNYVCSLYAKLKKWGPLLANSTNTEGWSVHRNTANHEFISDIKSIYRNPSSPFDFSPGNEDGTKYWEMGFFNPNYLPANDKSKYFMMVNRRCVPEITGGEGDIRQLEIKFDSTDLVQFRNWKLIDVYTGNSVTFANSNLYIDLGNTSTSLGYFNPGEAKLFKLAPVMQEGGTIVTNESFGGVSLNCYDTVLNNNYDITIIGNSSSISFTDSALIIMSGGTFQSSDPQSSGPQKNVFSGLNGHNWNGLTFTISDVLIYNSKFMYISSPITNHALKMIDCPLGDIRNNQFILTIDTAGAVYSAYTGADIEYSGLYVNYNSVTMNDSRANAIQVQAFSGMTFPVYVESNTMTSNGYATGIMLSTVTGGIVNYNQITGFSTGMNIMYSAVDLYGNTITNTESESEGIFSSSGSILNMSASGQFLIAGQNNITNTSGYSKNVHVAGAVFFIDNGYNSFDILSSFPIQTWHLFGFFPESEYNTDAYYNCFKYNGVNIQDPDLPNNYITNGEYGDALTFNFIPYSCSEMNPGGEAIVNLGNGMYDTIPLRSGGGGGSISSRNEKTFVIPPDRILYDSICVQLRFRNYSAVKNTCYELINTFPDSLESIASLSKLFLAVTATDTTTTTINGLKTYYENLILNHPNNIALVKSCNYLVQKCKVRLRQYQSALNGFQQIINQNQYEYEGLLARWDYMATSLLIQGQGGSERGETPNVKCETDETKEFDLSNEALAQLDGYDQSDDDKNPFSIEERVAIQKNIRTAYERTKNYHEKKIEILQRESERNNERAKQELQKINKMKQVIKVEMPKNVIEHIKIVNNDIQTIFRSTLSNNSTPINIIPSVYRLAQNYPNPFNPITTIKYELPKDSKVKLVVYDLLGREVKTLVNEVKSAGYYQIEFNLQIYASGVYFYRIEADDLTGKKFVDAKKMVLVK